MSGIFNSELDSILEGTSRSFYLSLKQLPKAIRPQISLLYMLARTSDTIADSEKGDSHGRLVALESYSEFSQGLTDSPPDLHPLSELQENESEAALLMSVRGIVSKIEAFSDLDQEEIRRCLGVIISGQTLDLQRFPPNREKISSLDTDEELDDYAYRVAGSVGEFWTRMSLIHLFSLNEGDKESELFENGIRFGKALQMINILRDIPADLALGRCYIPRKRLEEIHLVPEDLLDHTRMEEFRPLYNEYLDLTDEYLTSATKYIETIPHSQFRLRGSCMLPVIIGRRTISLLRGKNILDPEHRIKIDRSEIKEVVKKVVLAVPFRASSKKILRE